MLLLSLIFRIYKLLMLVDFCPCRRQVFWISKQILQLVMEDAIDDWLLREIHWLRREDTIAQGIRWVQDVRSEPQYWKSFTAGTVCQLINDFSFFFLCKLTVSHNDILHLDLTKIVFYLNTKEKQYNESYTIARERTMVPLKNMSILIWLKKPKDCINCLHPICSY